jgi:hypothetical protein
VLDLQIELPRLAQASGIKPAARRAASTTPWKACFGYLVER